MSPEERQQWHDDEDALRLAAQESASEATETGERAARAAQSTAASAAAVEAAQKDPAIGCWQLQGPDGWPPYCGHHGEEHTDRGCPVAVRVADAVVEALGLTVETQREHVPHYGSFSDHRCGDPTEPCHRFIRTRYVSEWREVEP